jgi:hypothetical protein
VAGGGGSDLWPGEEKLPTMDSGGSPPFSSAAGPLLSLLRAPEARMGSRNGRDGSVKLRADGGGERLDETASLDGRMRGKPARYAFAGAGRILHHILWQHPCFLVGQIAFL